MSSAESPTVLPEPDFGRSYGGWGVIVSSTESPTMLPEPDLLIQCRPDVIARLMQLLLYAACISIDDDCMNA